MLQPGKAVKVTIYLSDGATHHGVPLYSSILDFLFYRGVAGATVTKGIAGFGADHHMHAAHWSKSPTACPSRSSSLRAARRSTHCWASWKSWPAAGLIEMQETTVAKPAQLSKPKKPLTPAHLKIEGKAQMMRIFLSEEDRWK